MKEEKKNPLNEEETRLELVEKIAAKWRRQDSGNKEYYVPIPDNDGAFYAFVNLVINNRDNANVPQHADSRPKDFGPVKNVHLVINEVGEHFLIAHSLKDKKFLEMLVNQFTLLRTHWDTISNLVEYPEQDKYSD